MSRLSTIKKAPLRAPEIALRSKSEAVEINTMNDSNEISGLIEIYRSNRGISTRELTESEWLKLRRLGIGASEAYAAAGLSDYRTAYEVVEDKLGLSSESVADSYRRRQKMEAGHAMEPVTASRFSEATGLKTQQYHRMVMHPEHDYMYANIDRRIIGISDEQRDWLEHVFNQPVEGVGLAELKNVEFGREWGKPDDPMLTGGLCTSGEVPEAYYIQVQHQLACLGYKWGFLVVTIAGWETRWYPILRDDETIEDLIAIHADLWRHVENGTLPEIDTDHPRAQDLLKRLHPGTDGTVIRLSDLDHWRRVEQEAKAEIKELETTARKARSRILKHMGDSAVAIFDDKTCIRRKVVEPKTYTVEPKPYILATYGKPGRNELNALEEQQQEETA